MKRAWTEKEDAVLREFRETHTTAQIARMLNRTGMAVIGRADRLGLPRIKPEVIAERVSAGLAHHRFKFGKQRVGLITHAERCPHCSQRFVKITSHMRRCRERRAAA